MDPETDARLRPLLMLLGGFAGVAAWLFADHFDDSFADPRAYMTLVVFASGFFGVLLALVGPARLGRSLPAALGIALVMAGLMYWASFRHDAPRDFLEMGYPGLACFLLWMIATSFAAAGLRNDTRWHAYDVLFDISWRVFIRYLAAMLFTGLFWGLLTLSDALLQLVGLRLLSLIRSVDPLPWVLTGAVFGLALAVVHEMRRMLSPDLLLALLRLLVPVALVVIAVFLLALPMRGLSDLVGSLSAGGTLMSAALAAIVLVTVAVDRDTDAEIALPWMRIATQTLALLIPALAALALYALWLRVGQYGWTPARLTAVTVGAVVAIYGVSFGGAVLLRHNWAARIRKANVGVALLIVAISALWLTPLMVPERIAAQDQLARYNAGRLPADALPLHELANDWGRPGREVLAVLKRDPTLGTEFSKQLQDGGVIPRDSVKARATLARDMPVRGADPLTAAMLSDLNDTEVADWRAACARTVRGGPGCGMVMGQFSDAAVKGVVLLLQDDGTLRALSVMLMDSRIKLVGYVVTLTGEIGAGLPPSALEAFHAGEVTIGPSMTPVLKLGSVEIFPHN
ncbi:DUF4153 domain-containing protein [Puniceibacterium sp. IMCC21224]|uniref:DUF4153 domain-containing protein n=1 Tax=Puniceibacterium sp. IMCC21224 TaxID=1618204 RepID=UPI00065D9FE4|nr:DUF4153 domain-containing protein [Puniceibacterium sp. IMCC21224]KMK68096.1 protein of unknown function (DUF4153) [Puniceibacterium sp. IMCC21224]